MFKQTLAAGALALALVSPLSAQTYSTTGAYSSATVGVSDGALLAAGNGYHFLDLINNSPTATICISFGASAATITGTTCAAGEITLPPLWHRSWEGIFVPVDAIRAISSVASTPMTIGSK